MVIVLREIVALIFFVCCGLIAFALTRFGAFSFALTCVFYAAYLHYRNG